MLKKVSRGNPNIVTLHVRAFSPKEAQDTANAILKLSGDYVAQLSSQMMNESTTAAQGDVNSARVEAVKAHTATAAFQGKSRTLDVGAYGSAASSQVLSLEATITQLQAQLASLRTYSNSSHNETRTPLWSDQTKNQRFLGVQLAVSVTFGLSAFLAFCALRPRWTQLYNARKKQSQSAARLPDLPKSFLGWIPILWNISREDVLAAAGLDAFAFLSFFRYAIKYLSIVLFFALTVFLGAPGRPMCYDNR